MLTLHIDIGLHSTSQNVHGYNCASMISITLLSN